MPKRLNEIQKKEISKRFLNGETLDILADQYGFTKLTILKHIKKSIGTELFNNLNKNMKTTDKNKLSGEKLKMHNISQEIKKDNLNFEKEQIDQKFKENNFIENSPFMELAFGSGYR